MPPCHVPLEKVSESDHVAQLRDAQLLAHRPKLRHAGSCAGTALQKPGGAPALGQLWTLNAGRRRQPRAPHDVQDCTCMTMASDHRGDTLALATILSSLTKMRCQPGLQSWMLNAGHERARPASIFRGPQSWTLNAGHEAARSASMFRVHLVLKSISASSSAWGLEAGHGTPRVDSGCFPLPWGTNSAGAHSPQAH